MAKGEKDPLPVYELHPPEWLPPAHASGDIGYIGFYPPRPNDVEETLTEASVKHGLVLKPEVLAEHYSQQHEIRKRLMQDDALSVLEDVMNQIFARKAESAPSIPSSSFRLPSRVTLNDGKRLAWFADLANPDIPLSKLGKNVPHGAKGHDLLDLLHTNNVAIPRAVWFLRVFGANESAGLRNRPSYNPTQYSVEWANVMTSYMKKQLADIALPSAPRLVASIKQTFKGVLSDADMRQKWISRFSYCLSLLRTFYAEGLVDNRTFLAWLVRRRVGLEWRAGAIRAADASGRAREGDSTAVNFVDEDDGILSLRRRHTALRPGGAEGTEPDESELEAGTPRRNSSRRARKRRAAQQRHRPPCSVAFAKCGRLYGGTSRDPRRTRAPRSRLFRT